MTEFDNLNAHQEESNEDDRTEDTEDGATRLPIPGR